MLKAPLIILRDIQIILNVQGPILVVEGALKPLEYIIMQISHQYTSTFLLLDTFIHVYCSCTANILVPVVTSYSSSMCYLAQAPDRRLFFLWMLDNSCYMAKLNIFHVCYTDLLSYVFNEHSIFIEL